MGRVWKQIFHILWNIFIFYEFSCSRISLFCLDHGTLKKRPTVAQQGGKTGGQSACRVKQKSHICSSREEVFVKFMETCYRVTLQYLLGTTNYKVQPSWEEKRAAENKFGDLLTDRFFYFCKLDGGKKTKYKIVWLWCFHSWIWTSKCLSISANLQYLLPCKKLLIAKSIQIRTENRR